MLDLIKIFDKYKIPKKGVLHIGAHEGGEVDKYHQMGFGKKLFVEANPKVFSRLENTVKGYPNVFTICCAISNTTGLCSFHVTSMDQSSSILPLKHHKEVYPSIVETEVIQVRCTTMDALLNGLGLSLGDFNFINIDIQGAELLAFQGATNLLEKSIVAINTEVNYKEMYEGCALKNEIDVFLAGFGFKCVETITPHPTWGDAFYVKEV